MSNLEELLLQREEDRKPNKNEYVLSGNEAIYHSMSKSDKGATLNDFIKMLDKLITLTMKNVRFMPEEGKILTIDAMADFDKPVITHKVISRKPTKEIKPRVREAVLEKDNLDDKRVGTVYGQKFECYVQFNIIASKYSLAEEIMEKFEELIMSYTGYFKRNGVSEITFSQQITDENYAKIRETLSIRNLIYRVEIEKSTVIFKEKIKEIEILADKKEEK